MSRSYLAAILLTVAASTLVYGQQPHGLTGDHWFPPQHDSFDALVHGQTAEVVPVEYRRNSKLMEFSEYRTMGGRLVPARMDVIPSDKPAERTSLIYHELEFDLGLEASFFSLRNLRARR